MTWSFNDSLDEPSFQLLPAGSSRISLTSLQFDRKNWLSAHRTMWSNCTGIEPLRRTNPIFSLTNRRYLCWYELMHRGQLHQWWNSREELVFAEIFAVQTKRSAADKFSRPKMDAITGWTLSKKESPFLSRESRAQTHLATKQTFSASTKREEGDCEGEICLFFCIAGVILRSVELKRL